jgi:sugar/nucleoside kinase (ribokinase family)
MIMDYLRPLNINPSRLRYQALIGTGGVGSGLFFAIEGNTTLGREESRGGRLLAHKDYCKLHIIAHYVKVLLGAGFTVFPASKVGSDTIGQQTLLEMAETGLDMRYMEVSTDEATLFSVCFGYPDGSGGNLTATNSATAKVDSIFIEQLRPEFMRWHGQGIALAAPEVPLPARLRLLELGSEYDFFNATSLTSEEARSTEALGLIAHTQLLALNLDEAAALAGLSAEGHTPFEIFLAAREKACAENADLQLSVTAGIQGSWNWDGNQAAHTPSFPANVRGSAGAGDAHLAAMLAGLTAGLSLSKAQQLAALAAAVSVTSPDTIHHGLNCDAMLTFAIENHLHLDPEVQDCIHDPDHSIKEKYI